MSFFHLEGLEHEFFLAARTADVNGMVETGVFGQRLFVPDELPQAARYAVPGMPWRLYPSRRCRERRNWSRSLSKQAGFLTKRVLE
jgi:hypothetical protein